MLGTTLDLGSTDPGTGFWRPGDLELQGSEIQIFRDPEIWRSGYQKIQGSRDLEIRRFWDQEILGSGDPGIWRSWNPEIRGSRDSEIHGFLNPGIPRSGDPEIWEYAIWRIWGSWDLGICCSDCSSSFQPTVHMPI